MNQRVIRFKFLNGTRFFLGFFLFSLVDLAPWWNIDEPTNSEIEEIVRKELEERNLEGLVRVGMLIIPDKEKRQTSVLFQGVKAGKGKIIVNWDDGSVEIEEEDNEERKP